MLFRSAPVIEVCDYLSGSYFLGDSIVKIDNPINPNEKIDINTISYDEKTNKRNGYTFKDKAVFSQGNVYYLKVNLIEEYRNKYWEEGIVDKVPVSDGTLEISNNLAEEKASMISLDENGEAIYSFVGGQAYLTKDNTNPLDSYSAVMNITAVSGEGSVYTNWRESDNQFRAYLLGGVITGSNFTTKGPQKVDMVLRDPPGSNSYATYHKGSYSGSNYSFEYKNGATEEAKQEIIIGTDISTGFGVMVKALESENIVGLYVEAEERKVNGNTWETRITLGFPSNIQPLQLGFSLDC